MKGDLLYVDRYPLGLEPVDNRRNPRSCWLDVLLMRVLTYKHYGIDAGEGQVFHYRCESILAIHEATVCLTSMAEFARDGEVHVDRSLLPAFLPEEIVQRATDQLHSNFDGYRIKHNNCEHFAVWCFTGERVGKQDLLREAWQRSLQLPLRTKEKMLAALACFTFFH